MGALAFFGASRIKSIWGSLALVVAAMMITDLVINNLIYPTGEFVLMYSGSLFTYAGFAAFASRSQSNEHKKWFNVACRRFYSVLLAQ